MNKTEALKLALERAFSLGQTYWQQSDSEYSSQWKKSDETREKFKQLVENTIKEALAQPSDSVEHAPVALQDDEIYDAAYSAYCRGENSRELFRIMWSNRLTCSIGWDRDELKSFAKNISALYTTPPQRNPLTDAELKLELEKLYPNDIGILELAENNKDFAVKAIGACHHCAAFKAGAKAIEATHGIKGGKHERV